MKNMFIESEYKNSRGRTYKQYLINRDGFSLLAMGFTGKEALNWKLKYIEAFNEMEKQLFARSSEKKLPGNYKEALIQLLEEVERNEELEKENTELKPKAKYYDDVLNKEGLINISTIAKDIGTHAAKLHEIMNVNRILFKRGKTWYPYVEYEWLITNGYADYKSYREEKYDPCLKWTETGRKWIVENYDKWLEKYNSIYCVS